MNQNINRILAVCLIITFLAACTVKTVYFHPLEPHTIEKQPHIDIRTKDGNNVKVFKPRLVGNTLFGETGDGKKLEIDTESIQTMTAQVSKTDWILTTLYGGLAVLMAVLAVKESNAPNRPPSSGESCPFIYTFDGHRYILEAEPYGGAIAEGLARTEWIPLEWLADVGGEYRLLLANELTETEHTDELSLLIADHKPGMRVLPDGLGRLYAVKNPQAPLSALSKSGCSLLPELESRDFLFWEGGKDAVPVIQSGDLREEIILTFPKPADANEAKLITDAWTTIEGSKIAKDFLENLGSDTPAFFQDVDARGPAYFKIMSWYNREELYLLHVEVETSSGWKKRAVIYGGGPFVQKEKCYIFDVSDIPGDILRVRIRPPLGFWRINSLAVDYSKDEPFAMQKLNLLRAQAGDGRNIAAALSQTDGIYHIMPEGSHPVDLRFIAPPVQPGLSRSIILKASGWYDPHFNTTAEPQREAAERILLEPGFAVRWAVKRWRR